MNLVFRKARAIEMKIEGAQFLVEVEVEEGR